MERTKLTPSVPEGYAAIEDAAKIGNVSDKTIRNWAKRRLVGARVHKRPGITPIKVYNIADIERQAAKQTELLLAPATMAVAVSENKQVATRDQRLFEALRPEALEHRDVLTIAEAVRLKGYPASYLESLHAQGRLRFYKLPGRRGRMIRRRDLDQLAGIDLPDWT